MNISTVPAAEATEEALQGASDAVRAALAVTRRGCEELLPVADWVRKQRPNDALWLAGFSFGSWVALQGARHLPVKQMISIAPPVGLREFAGVLPPPCPWLVVQGEADDIVDPQAVYDWIDALKDKPTLVRMPDTGHFFHRRLMDLRGAIKNGVRKNLPPPRHG